MQNPLAIINVNAGVDTFDTWVDKTNLGITAVSNNAVVVISNSTGDSVNGNGWVNGTFGATTFFAGTIRGGNVVSSANLIVSSNITFQGITVIGGVGLFGNIITTTGTSQQIIDQFPMASYRGAKYVFSANNNSANGYQITEIMIMHDGGNTYTTEYGTLSSNGTIGTFATAIVGANVQLLYTPVPANTTLQFSSQRLPV